jgi:hypothetical protein
VSGRPRAAVIQSPLIPVNVDVGLHARAAGRHVQLTWRPDHPAGGPVFFHIFRSPRAAASFECPPGPPAEQCRLTATTDLGTTRSLTFVDAPPTGGWQYRVGIAANWLNDPAYGDVYVLSSPVTVTVP